VAAYEAAGVGGTQLSAAYTTLGDMLGHLDRKEESEAVLRKAVDVLREEYGEAGHPVLASALHNLAGPLMQSNLAETANQERLAEAEALLTESLEMLQRTLGESHWRVGIAYSGLSVVKTKQGDIEAAGETLQEAVRITREAVGENHPALAAPLSNLARNLLRQKRYDEAAVVYDEAIAVARHCFGEKHQYVSHPLAGYGDLCTETGRLDEAERAISEAWEIRRDTFGEHHSLVVETRVQLAGVIAAEGRGTDAIAMLDGAVGDARGGLPDTRTVLASALLARARQGRLVGESADALAPMLDEARGIREDEYGAEDPRAAEVREEIVSLTTGPGQSTSR
jgi:tetratricopeptide (TPR) repeat protein